MKMFAMLAGSLWVIFFAGCAKPDARLADLCIQGTNQFPDACSILVERVEENRGMLHNRRIDIKGYLVFDYYFMGVYPTKDHAELGLTRRAVRVQTPHDSAGYEQLVSMNNQAVRIVGVFVDDGRRGVPEWAGSIKIDDISLVPPNLETEVRPLIELELEP